jgi:hypothetical protein
MPFNSEGMYRAKKSNDGELFIKIYKDWFSIIDFWCWI